MKFVKSYRFIYITGTYIFSWANKIDTPFISILIVRTIRMEVVLPQLQNLGFNLNFVLLVEDEAICLSA